MEDCNCKRQYKKIDEIVVDNASSSTSSMSPKRRKVDVNVELQEHECLSEKLLEKTMSENSGEDSCSINCFGCDFVVSRLSSDDECSKEVVQKRLRFEDLEAKSFKTESSTYINNKFSRETTPLSGYGDTEDIESTTKPKVISQLKTSACKMPSQDEIDEFFSVSDKYEQMKFVEKYNYDIAKDVPLEGRYEWIPLKP